MGFRSARGSNPTLSAIRLAFVLPNHCGLRLLRYSRSGASPPGSAAPTGHSKPRLNHGVEVARNPNRRRAFAVRGPRHQRAAHDAFHCPGQRTYIHFASQLADCYGRPEQSFDLAPGRERVRYHTITEGVVREVGLEIREIT